MRPLDIADRLSVRKLRDSSEKEWSLGSHAPKTGPGLTRRKTHPLGTERPSRLREQIAPGRAMLRARACSFRFMVVHYPFQLPNPFPGGDYLIRTLTSMNGHFASDAQKLIETLCHESSASLQEGLVVLDPKKSLFRRNALCVKRCEPGLFDHRRKVLLRWLVADLAVGFPGDEAQIRDVVCLTT